MIKSAIIVTAIIVAITGGWIFFREPALDGPPPLQADEVRITYAHGETCLLQGWSFTIRRQVQNSSSRGAMVTMGRPSIQRAVDTDLRVFSPTGEKLLIPRSDLRKIELESLPDPDYDGYNRVTSLTLTTATESIIFDATELPGFSRSRLLVPVASHYFPDQNDDYMRWGNVRMILEGTVTGECSTDRVIGLTVPDHPKKRTPVLIEFASL